MKKIVSFLKKARTKIASLVAVGTMALTTAVVNAESSATTPSLDIDFDIEQCFQWAQTIIGAMLPVVYITMGVGLGFLIIRAFKSAFNG